MAIDNKMLVPIVACIVVVAAVAVAAVFVFNGNNNSSYNVTIDEGQSITSAQLEDLKKHAEEDSGTTLTYKASSYTVVFDSKAIANINSVADLSLKKVEVSTLSTEVQNDIGNDAQVIDLSYGENKNFGDGTVKVTIDYTVPNGQDANNAAGTYISTDGKLESVPVTISGNKATLTLSHFSTYSISYPTEDRLLSSAELKVYGNIDRNTTITSEDADALQALVDKGMPAKLYPLADANQDGTLNADDVTVINNVISGTKTTIWHINYHDTNGDGIMDEELVSTTVPVTSTLMTGSANNFMMLYLLGIVDEVKGACYGSSNDTALFGDTYLDKNKVELLNSVSTTIPFEDGKAGASDIISKKSVTGLITDWNRTYIENEKDFENAHVDVVRISAAASDKETYTHSIALLGVVFNKVSNAEALIKLYDDTFQTISDATSGLSDDAKVKVVASSMTGYLSSKDSDYTAFCEKAGGVFGLEGFDFGGSTSATVADNLGIFKYDFDNIVHIRTALNYGADEATIATQWAQNANAMKMWKHVYDGQVIVSGSIPVPVRVAYIAYALYGDTIPALSKTWADGIHSNFTELYAKSVDLSKTFVLTGYEFGVNFDDSLTVTNGDTPITSGDKFTYGTTLKVAVKGGCEKDGYVILIEGSTLDDSNNFSVLDTITLRYVDPAVLEALSEMATNMATKCKSFYVQNAVPNSGNEGAVAVTNMSYKGASSTGSYSPAFVYYDNASDTASAYEALKAKVLEKATGDAQTVDCTKFIDDDSVDGMCIVITTSRAADTKPVDQRYIGSTLYGVAYKGNYLIDLFNKPGYLGGYGYDTDLWTNSAEDKTELKAFLMVEGNKFAKGLAYCFTPTVEIPETGADNASTCASDIVTALTTTGARATWFVADGATENSATVKETYSTTMGGEKTISPFELTKSADINTDYANAVSDLKAMIGTDKAYMSNTYMDYTAGSDIDGVVYSAIWQESSGAWYVRFVMAAGDMLVTPGDKGAYVFKNSDTVTGEWDSIQAFLTAVASAVKA